ncbi:MAG: hypothetical protein Q8Q23_04875 [bacterium]|nr:hypothetical protein [bacterium]
MAKNNNNLDELAVVLSWPVALFDRHARGRLWYIASSFIVLILLGLSYFTDNFLLAVIVVLGAAIVILLDNREDEKIDFSIVDEGLILGNKFIDYDDLRNFSIVYKPRQNIKRLYFEYNNVLKPRISIYIDDMNPLKIREVLLNYLQEDLDREGEPLSENLSRLLKI